MSPAGRDAARPVRAADFDVVIVGAGIIGATLASLLVRRGLCARGRIALVAPRFDAEPTAEGEWDLRVFALSRASERVLEAAGAWQGVAAGRMLAYERMRVWDEGGIARGDGALAFDCAEIGEPNLGHIVEGRALQASSLAAARAAGITRVESGLRNVAADDTFMDVELEDGRRLTAHLLVAADGPGSITRGLLGIGTAGHAYGQDALVAHVRTARPHESTAWQRFLRTGPLAFLPLPDGRSSIVWSAILPEAARLRALTPAELGAALTEASGEVLGACELTTPLAGFPLRLQHAVSYVRTGAVLVGDAAHVVHPLAGQGLNLGLMDCAVLVEELHEAREPRRLGELKLLRRYERRRRGENLAAAAALDGLERLFSSTGALSIGARGAALRIANRVSFVKDGLARRALGVSGDVPGWLRR